MRRTLPGFSKYLLSIFTNQLFGRFIHTNHRILLIIWKMVNIQDIFHRRNKGGGAFDTRLLAFEKIRIKFIEYILAVIGVEQ